MIEQYILFENLQKDKKILNDRHIPEDNDGFLKLRDMLKNNLGYIGQFTKWMFEQHTSFEKLEEIFKELQTSNIDKNIEEFEKAEDLYDYIQSFRIKQKTQQVIKYLPSRTRQLVNDELKELISLNIEYAPLIKDWYSKKGGRYKEIDSLIKDTKEFIKNIKGGFSAESIRKKVDEVNSKYSFKNSEGELVPAAEIEEDTPELMMVRINNYDASKALGSKHWCITTSDSYFRQYVNEFTNQYFIYDFTKDISDKRHMIGATLSTGDKISNAHWADDSWVKDADKVFDELG